MKARSEVREQGLIRASVCVALLYLKAHCGCWLEYSTLTHTHTHLAPTNGSLVVLASEEGNTCRYTFSKNFKDTLELLEMVK